MGLISNISKPVVSSPASCGIFVNVAQVLPQVPSVMIINLLGGIYDDGTYTDDSDANDDDDDDFDVVDDDSGNASASWQSSAKRLVR